MKHLITGLMAVSLVACASNNYKAGMSASVAKPAVPMASLSLAASPDYDFDKNPNDYLVPEFKAINGKYIVKHDRKDLSCSDQQCKYTVVMLEPGKHRLIVKLTDVNGSYKEGFPIEVKIKKADHYQVKFPKTASGRYLINECLMWIENTRTGKVISGQRFDINNPSEVTCDD